MAAARLAIINDTELRSAEEVYVACADHESMTCTFGA